MNERIQELYKQALENKFDYSGGVGVKTGEYYSNYKTVLNAEKFAELIVRECVQVCADRGTHHDGLYSAWAEDCSKRIAKHFGVEDA